MSIPKWLQIGHDQVFPFGAFLVSEVTPIIDFDKSSGDNRVQARDRDTGLPMWQVEVLDGDPAAPKRSRTVTVKFASDAAVCARQLQQDTLYPSVFRRAHGAAVRREVGRLLSDRLVLSSVRHEGAG